MTRTVLVLNSGSSSFKYQLVDPDAGTRLADGVVDRIGEDRSTIEHTAGGTTTERHARLGTHEDALTTVIDLFDEVGPPLDQAGIVAVGHRVVMGGREFAGPALVDDDVLATIDALSPLAPLHNPANLAGITVARTLLRDVPHVAVFDTAFFHDLPAAATTYALDREVAERHGIRRYGFHGTSHQYVSRAAARFLGRDLADLRQIVLHLGNGASASAIAGGRPVDTSMGMTPLEGLVMGTRSGDIDPAVVLHLARTAGMDLGDIDALLNRRSGMRGLTGHNDMRTVHALIADGDHDARLGLDVYVHRLRKYVGAYTALLGGLDVLTFTAGVGENDAIVRARVTEGLGVLGIEVDPDRNEARRDQPRRISPNGARVEVLVVPTDEELVIARGTVSLL